MSFLTTLRNAVPPIHREGYKFIALFFAVSLLLGVFAAELFWFGLLLTIGCALFFRDPERVTPLDSSLVVSPADGVIVALQEALPLPELQLGAAPHLKISIFMSVFDVHVNRAPVNGAVTATPYRPGKFLSADLDKASEDNERQGFTLEMDDGKRIGVVQIAGLIARRIVAFARAGDRLAVGERIGLIRFGSRVDLYLPLSAKPLVAMGQRTVAGETVLAAFDARPALTAARKG